MPTWDDLLKEITSQKIVGSNGQVQIDFDITRRKYIKKLADYRNRNVIVYYSDWLHQSGDNMDINDGDMTGFMTTTKGLDFNKGLDLVIHTPGGNPLATESIVKYLHKLFNNIQVFVPHMCMSAGTMLACSASKIYLGKESSLGPIDPQFNGVPAFNIKKEFEDAKAELVSKPDTFRYWQIILSKYPPAFYYSVLDSLKLSSELLQSWLQEYMFKNENDHDKIINIVNILNSNAGSHAKHFDYDFCKNIGLQVEKLEDNQKLQDLVLSVYHCCSICANSTLMIKIIENNLNKSYICNKQR